MRSRSALAVIVCALVAGLFATPSEPDALIAIERALSDYDAIREVGFGGGDKLFEDFRRRELQEQEIRSRLRALGPCAVAPMVEKILRTDDRAHVLLLTKVLCERDDPLAHLGLSVVLLASEERRLIARVARNFFLGP